jgi:3-isopropylmalate/(R)-2-methylmalate dehydratase small subunit
VLQSEEASDNLRAGDEVEIDFGGGTIMAGEKTYKFPPFPDSVIGILEAGGLIEYTKNKLQIQAKT